MYLWFTVVLKIKQIVTGAFVIPTPHPVWDPSHVFRSIPLLSPPGIQLSKTEMKMNIRPLLRLVCQRFFGEHTSALSLPVHPLSLPSQPVCMHNVHLDTHTHTLSTHAHMRTHHPHKPTLYTWFFDSDSCFCLPLSLSFSQVLWTCVSSTSPPL